MSLKLCYIWVEEYRNFENFGVNFSSAEKFDYNHSTGLISHEAINKLPNNFFENDRILDVTGIIGKNGTGKSNLLELACSLLKGGTTSIKSKFLIIIKRFNGYECHSSPELTHIFNANLPMAMTMYNRAIEPFKVIFFSNVYDEREHFFDSRISNLSGNYRFKKTRYTSSNKTSDFVKQLQFVRGPFMDRSEIPYPDEISITIKKLNVSQRTRRLNFMPNDSNNFEDYLNSFYKDIGALKASVDKLYYSIVFSLILDFSSFVSYELEDFSLISDELQRITESLIIDVEEIQNSYKSKLAIAQKWESWLRTSLNLVISISNSDTNLDNKIKDIIEEHKDILKILERFSEFINKDDLKIEVEGSRGRKQEKYIVRFKRETSKLEEQFYNYFDKDSKFNLNWLGLSSGHKAYLDFFSLLWFELKNIKTQNVIIFIDEGDLYLHPKWQADFFYKLITLIPQFREVNFQFVLTSHSPFLVSDLPNENLVFLSSNTNHQIEVVEKPEIKTFGGNLGDLYINAFFMEGALISRFAAKKIQDVVDKINDKQSRLTTNDKKLIDLIGEDLIRLQIENILNDSNRG